MARRRARRPRVRPRSPVREVCGGASFGYLRSWHLPQRRRRRYQRCLKDVSAVWRTTPEMGDLPSARQMEFLILGPLEVRSNGHSLALGGPKQRAVLALLLLGANRVVSREHLIAELWPDAPGRDSEHALRLQISRLRRALSAAGDGEDRVVTRAPGYSLRVEPGELDLERYERLVAAGRAALEARDADSAVARLREAESLWRGRPLADLEFEPFARLDVERLEERRLTALEERIEAEVAAGRHRELVPELEGLIAEHPLRERLRAQLMRALYASSRQAEALAVYTDTRRLLVDELGIEPSALLRELERQILNQDAGLLYRQPAPPAPPAPEGIREPQRTRPRLVRRALLGIPALGGMLLLVILLSGDQRPQRLRIPGPGAVLFLGAGSGDPLGQVPTGPGASRMRFGLGALWKLEDPGELLQIDPPSMWLKRTVPIGFAGDIAVAGNGVWISGDTNTLVRVDPIYGTVAQRIRLPHHGAERPRSGGGVAFGAGSVWASQGHSRVLRIDPVGERIQHVFDVPDAGVLAFGGGALWVGSSELGKLTKIDPRSNAIVASVHVGPSICCLAAGGGYVWAANDSGVWKISSDGRPIAVTELPSEAGEMSYGEGALWATSAGYVIRVNARSGTAKRWHVGYSLNGIAAAGGRVAVSVYVPTQPEPNPHLRGKILRVARSTVWFDVTDPALSAVPGVRSWPAEQQLQDATCAGLLRYRPAAAPIRWRLVPEVAAALPAVSRGARTFTFRIRSGFRFSPPSNQRLTAQTFKYTIERALSPNLGAQAAAMELASDIVGARAYHARAGPHISGISAHGHTLAITLTRRARLPRPAHYGAVLPGADRHADRRHGRPRRADPVRRPLLPDGKRRRRACRDPAQPQLPRSAAPHPRRHRLPRRGSLRHDRRARRDGQGRLRRRSRSGVAPRIDNRQALQRGPLRHTPLLPHPDAGNGRARLQHRARPAQGCAPAARDQLCPGPAGGRGRLRRRGDGPLPAADDAGRARRPRLSPRQARHHTGTKPDARPPAHA